jgi:hypothetical protein
MPESASLDQQSAELIGVISSLSENSRKSLLQYALFLKENDTAPDQAALEELDSQLNALLEGDKPDLQTGNA